MNHSDLLQTLKYSVNQDLSLIYGVQMDQFTLLLVLANVTANLSVKLRFKTIQEH